jgi:hypothetical protein
MTRRDRIGDVHCARRPGKTAEIRNLDEHAHRLQMIHNDSCRCYNFKKLKQMRNSPTTAEMMQSCSTTAALTIKMVKNPHRLRMDDPIILISTTIR